MTGMSEIHAVAVYCGSRHGNSPAYRAAAQALGHGLATAGMRLVTPPWREASTTSDWHLRLTPARAEELVDTLARLVEEWSENEDDESTPGTGNFVINLNAFPRPGTIVLEGDER